MRHKVTLYGPRPYGGTITTRVDDPLVTAALDRGWAVSRLWAVTIPPDGEPEPADEPADEPTHEGPRGPAPVDPGRDAHPSGGLAVRPLPYAVPDSDEIELDRIVSIVEGRWP